MAEAQPLAEKWLANIVPEPNSGCWLWDGYVTRSGYARAMANRKGYAVHRVFYTAHNGEIPPGLVLDHLCRVRSCVNPAHLEAVTNEENIRRGEGGLHMRIRTHCPHGHEYTPENIKTYADLPFANRECRKCRNIRHWGYKRGIPFKEALLILTESEMAMRSAKPHAKTGKFATLAFPLPRLTPQGEAQEKK